MAIAKILKETMNSKGAGVIRAMFEAGIHMKKEFGEDNVYDFSLGNPDLEAPKEVVDAVKEIANDADPTRHGYMSNMGYTETRLAMAQKVSMEQGLTGTNALTENNVLITVGAAGALNVVFKSILNPNDKVLVSTPFFPEYTHYAKNHGGTLLPVLSNDDLSISIENFEKALAENDVAAVIINSPNNPSGKIYSQENIEALVNVLKKHGEKTGRYPYILCDEPYREITYNNKKVPAICPLYNNTIIMSSFAKNLSLPGERIGYIAINPTCEDSAELLAACSFANRTLGFVNAPAFFQKVVARTWNANVDYSAYAKRRDMISNVVADAGIEFVEPEGAFYLFCKVPEPKRAENKNLAGDDFAFTDLLKANRILCSPGTAFGCAGWFRISYCVAEKTILNSAESFKTARANW